MKAWAHSAGASEPLQPHDEFVKEGGAVHILAVVGELLVIGGQSGALQIWGALDLAPRYRGWSKVGGELLDSSAVAQMSAKLGLGDTPVDELDYLEEGEEVPVEAVDEHTLSDCAAFPPCAPFPLILVRPSRRWRSTRSRAG